jgi:uncharacterized protein (DUF849 family)
MLLARDLAVDQDMGAFLVIVPHVARRVRSAAAWPVVARAQQGDRMRRIGVLMGGDETIPCISLATLLSREK